MNQLILKWWLTIILDVNGDKFLDPYELEAIFQYELDKMYDPNNPEVVVLLWFWAYFLDFFKIFFTFFYVFF